MEQLNRFLERYGIWLVLLVGTLMRFYRYDAWSFSNDEMSVLYRTSFDSFREIIDQGIRTEGHPAGFHFFVWGWTRLIGNTETLLRIPFILSGIASVGLLYALGKRWFSWQTGLLAATTLAVLEYPIVYSQLARPYSLGLTAMLLTAWFWTVFLRKTAPSPWAMVGYILAATACTYFHYFSMFGAALLGLAGLVLIPKMQRANYLVANAFVVLAYFPHLDIFLDQVAIGGLANWLGPPDADFPFTFLFYAFNSSVIITTIVAGLFLVGLLSLFRARKWNRFHGITLYLFLVPLVVGMVYSIWVSPILQHSTLIFGFPFFLLFLFALPFPSWRPFFPLVATLLLVAGASSTIFERDYYFSSQFGVFREPAEQLAEWQREYGTNDLAIAVNLNNPWYFDFFTHPKGDTLDYSVTQIDYGKPVGDFYRLVHGVSTPYFAYAWSSRFNPYEYEEIIRTKYAAKIAEHRYFNSGVSLYAYGHWETARPQHQWRNVYYEVDSFWSPPGVLDTHKVQMSVHEVLGPEAEFSSTFQAELGALSLNLEDDTLHFIGRVDLTDEETSPKLVMTFEREGEDALGWHAIEIRDFLLPQTTRSFSQISLPLPKGARSDDRVKCYIWKPGGGTVHIEAMMVYHR